MAYFYFIFFAPVSLGLEAAALVSLIFSLSSVTTHKEEASSLARAGNKTGAQV